jgi:Ribbon-helix-helix protein, copG family
MAEDPRQALVPLAGNEVWLTFGNMRYHTYMVRTTVYLPENTKQRMTEAARRSGISEAEFIRSAIEQRLREVLPRRRGSWGTVTFDEPGLARRVDDVLAEGFGQQ